MKNKEVNNKMGRRWLFLLIYGVVIALLLLFIIFWAPSKWFQKKIDEPKVDIKTYTLEEKKEHLLKKQYDYEYNILYADTKANYTYQCSGKLNGIEESGTCTLPKEEEYNSTNKDEVFKSLNNDYLDLEKLFNMIKDVSYEEKKYDGTTVYVYNLKINRLDTDIELYSNYDNIFEIRIDNVNEHYQLKYSNILY